MFVRAAGCSDETGARLNSCEVSLSLFLFHVLRKSRKSEEGKKKRMARVESARNRISISRAKKKKREKEGGREIGKGEGSNLGVVESCSRNLIPNTKKANFNEIQDRLWINLNLALSNFFELTPWEMKFGLEVVKSSSFKGQH